MTLHIKNCGLRDQDAIQTAIASGATFLGFLHYPPSARYIPVEEAAALAAQVPEGIARVAVVVNPENDLLSELLDAGYATHLQLHGDESPERVEEVRRLTGLPVIKAVGIANANDLARSCLYADCADFLLLDTKSPEYGGTGHCFDWTLLRDFRPDIPWFLSGGLNVDNIEEALNVTGARMVDVSSGIEKKKGVKDLAKIRAFNERAREAGESTT
jgi:phosphoribosylanthranilate isomerase